MDDEENVLRSLRRVLRGEDYVLRTAASAEEGLALMRAEPAHLVISDQRMPGTSGTDFLRTVRAHWPHAIRILLTGYSEIGAVLSAINEGAVFKVLTKPWNDEQLKLHIRRALECYELEAENRRLSAEILSQNEQLRSLNERLHERAEGVCADLDAMQRLLEDLPVAILFVDPEGLIVGANGLARHWFNAGRYGLVNEAAQEVLPPELGRVVAWHLGPPQRQGAGQLVLAGRCLGWCAGALMLGGHDRGTALVLWEAS